MDGYARFEAAANQNVTGIGQQWRTGIAHQHNPMPFNQRSDDHLAGGVFIVIVKSQHLWPRQTQCAQQ